MKLLVTGGCGFLGSNLAAEGIRRGWNVTVLDDLSRRGSTSNRDWLESEGAFHFEHADVRNASDVARVVRGCRPEVVFHVAGQVAMTTSLTNPRRDFEVNALGSFNVIQAVRDHAPGAFLAYSSTNKVYGDLEQFRYEEQATRWVCTDRPRGFAEDVALDFHSPYGCSKGCADQYMLDAHRMWGVSTVVFRHSSMYGGRQYATRDQGWIGWFCAQAIRQQETAGACQRTPFTISGNGKQVRDVLHVADMIDLYFTAVDKRQSASGQVFNIGGGVDNSLSLLELFVVLESELGLSLHYEHLPPRDSDQRVFIADVSKAEQLLNWRPQRDYHSGLRDMLKWCKSL